MSPETRFLRFVAKEPASCWLWTGSKDRHGYGTFNAGVRTAAGNVRPSGAHRVAYELWVGPIPPGLVIDHLCEVPLCVNPAHLEPVTNAENIARRYRRRNPTHCPKGHPWSAENTYRSGPAGRKCRRCHADYQGARYHREVRDAHAA